jgi:hypothetical protein
MTRACYSGTRLTEVAFLSVAVPICAVASMPRPPIHPTPSMVGYPTVSMASTSHPARLIHSHIRDALDKLQLVARLYTSRAPEFMALAMSAALDVNVEAVIANTEEMCGQLDDLWRLVAQQEYWAAGRESWTMPGAEASTLGGATDTSWTMAVPVSEGPVATETMLTYHTVPPSAVGTCSEMGFPKWVRPVGLKSNPWQCAWQCT